MRRFTAMLRRFAMRSEILDLLCLEIRASVVNVGDFSSVDITENFLL